MKNTKKVLALLLALMLTLALCACGSKQEEKTKNGNAQTDFSSLYDYAKRLEEAGNSEAAAAVYELIAKGGGAELIQKAHEDIPIIETVDEIKQIEGIFGKGGDGK